MSTPLQKPPRPALCLSSGPSQAIFPIFRRPTEEILIFAHPSRRQVSKKWSLGPLPTWSARGPQPEAVWLPFHTVIHRQSTDTTRNMGFFDAFTERDSACSLPCSDATFLSTS